METVPIDQTTLAAAQESYLRSRPKVLEAIARRLGRLGGPEHLEELTQAAEALAWVRWRAAAARGLQPDRWPCQLARWVAYDVISGRRAEYLRTTAMPCSHRSQDRRRLGLCGLSEGTRSMAHHSAADLAASRELWARWLQSLTGRQRNVALLLASGHRACDTAHLEGIGRVWLCRVRQQLVQSWTTWLAAQD